MVNTQLRLRGIEDQAVLDAMKTVPREEFVPITERKLAYRDSPLPIEEGQTISQPFIVALMIEALRLMPDDVVLEVGAGSGYAAAVLSQIVARVFAIERYEVLADLARGRMSTLGYNNVSVLCGDGTRGWLEHAPYNAILVSASGPGIPESLKEQLAVGGRLIMPVGNSAYGQELVRVQRLDKAEYAEELLGGVQFVPLVGSEGWSDAEEHTPRFTF